jgi:hypothetical protein
MEVDLENFILIQLCNEWIKNKIHSALTMFSKKKKKKKKGPDYTRYTLLFYCLWVLMASQILLQMQLMQFHTTPTVMAMQYLNVRKFSSKLCCTFTVLFPPILNKNPTKKIGFKMQNHFHIQTVKPTGREI